MQAERPGTADAFLAEAAPLLLADEARHNLLLGLARTMRTRPDQHPDARFWIVRDGGRVAAAALRTPPFNLVLARPRGGRALDALVAGIDEELPGAIGAVPEIDGFAERWTEARGVLARRTMAQGVYALERVEPTPRPAGDAREAGAADRDLVVRWFEAFAQEVVHEGAPGRADAARSAEQRLASADAGVLLWERDGVPVSLAGWGNPTPSGIRVGPVYTPPELRGTGYATALVEELSRRLLSGGYRFCFLYTDLADPTANAIYQRIGYRRVCESAEVAFGPPETRPERTVV